MAAVIRDLGAGRYLVTDEVGRHHEAWALNHARATWVFFDGRVYQLPRATASRTRRPGSDETASLAAPMPATVTAVHVTRGQRVTRGDTLLTLEAMKMELPIKAPHDGTISRITCKAGDLVQPGVALVELDA